MGGGSGGATNTVSEFKPPEWAKDSFPDYLNQAKALTSKPYEQYQGQTVAGFNSDQNAGFDMAYQRATMGAPDLNAARGQITDTSNGMYLNANPWTGQQQMNRVIGDNTQNMTSAFRNGTAAQNDAMASRAGVYGGSAWEQKQRNDAGALAQQVGQMSNQYQLANQTMGSGNFEAERQRMMQAAPSAHQLAGDDYVGAQTLAGIGDAKRGLTQDLLNAQLAEWNKQQLDPMTKLDQFGNALTRSSGGMVSSSTATTGTSPGASPTANLLGAGMAAYGMYNK